MSFELEFQGPIPEYKSRLKFVNPMVIKYGEGPKDKRCKDCDLSVWVRPGQNIYIKCKLRGITHGAGTDHRANWETCSQFKKAKS